jgi:hypothetical protein
MQKKRLVLIGTAGAAAISLAAAALAIASDGHDPMTMFDKDGNGALSLAEVRSGAQSMFQKVDTNKDDRLSQDEMRAHHAMMAGPAHRGGEHHGAGTPPRGDNRPPLGVRGPMNMDGDGDGAITLAEAEATLARHFTRADANRDGSVTRLEMEAAHRTMHKSH